VRQGFGGMPNPCYIFSILGKFVVEAKCSIDGRYTLQRKGKKYTFERLDNVIQIG
jgi:hypothetical protein